MQPYAASAWRGLDSDILEPLVYPEHAEQFLDINVKYTVLATGMFRQPTDP